VNELLGIDVAQGGAVALVTLVVLLIFFGKLVPRRIVDDVRADRNDRIAELAAERDTWRNAYVESEKAHRQSQNQVDELLELSRAADHVLRSLRGEVPGDAMDKPVAAPPS
jgi:hypothetical protein